MFVCAARITLELRGASPARARRQTVRRIRDRLKARFNVSVAEVFHSGREEHVVLGLAVVGGTKAFVEEQIDKIFQSVEEMYVAAIAKRERELIVVGEDHFGDPPGSSTADLSIPRQERSLAEAEGLGAWERRHAPPAPRERPKLSLDAARARARSLRNRRDWEG